MLDWQPISWRSTCGRYQVDLHPATRTAFAWKISGEGAFDYVVGVDGSCVCPSLEEARKRCEEHAARAERSAEDLRADAVKRCVMEE